MPRGPRLDAPGLLHHVRARGIDRRKIFVDDRDRESFLERLAVVCQKQAAFIYAWALIPNHIHLAIRTGTRPLATTMQRLLTGYAVTFNARHRRVGHVFQNRYWSTVVEDEAYFLGLVRYIHLNPLRARLVAGLDQLASYRWTGHSALLGRQACSFQDTDEVLGRFGSRVSVARRKLLEFMGDEEAEQEAWLFRGGGLVRSMGEKPEEIPRSLGPGRRKRERQCYDERVLGSGQFVEALLEACEEDHGSTSATDENLQKLVAAICRRSKVKVEELKGSSRRRQITKLRSVLSLLATRHLGFSATTVARLLGQTTSAISQSVRNGEQALAELKWSVDEILKTSR